MSRIMIACLLALLFTRTSFADVWINEFHYDNNGGDTGEFIEIVLSSGVAINDISLVLYNGTGGGTYGSSITDFTVGDLVDGFRFYSVSTPGIQNDTDGIALVNNGIVEQFLSYEGMFTASDGPANGLESVDIGVSQQPAPEAGFSLYLTGAGSTYGDFTWTSGVATQSRLNTGQSFSAVPEPSAFLFGGIALGLVGAWRFAKRNWVAAK